jgi:hypothetical protein
VLQRDANALTNLRFGPDPRAWQDWCDTEDRCVQAAITRLDEAESRSQEAAAVQSVRDLARSPIDHDDIQERLAPLATSRMPDRAIARSAQQDRGLEDRNGPGADAADAEPIQPSAPQAPAASAVPPEQGGSGWMHWLSHGPGASGGSLVVAAATSGPRHRRQPRRAPLAHRT